MSSLAFGFGAVFTVGGLAAALIGTSQIHEQHRILTSAGRTIGVVRRSAIVSRPVMLSDKRCIAVVEFDYVVNGQHYTGTSAELRQEWTTFDRSREIVMATRRGKPATVFYDRQRPSTAYLFPRHSLFPYLIVLAGLGSLALGVGVLLMGGVRSRPALAAAGGTTLIHPSTTMGHVAKSLGWSGLILQVGGVITLGHYFLVSESPEIGAWVWGGTFEVPCLAVLGLFVYYYLTANRIGDALIIIPSRTVLGSPLPIRISQLVRRDLFLESLAVELVRVIKVAGHGKGRVDEQVVARQEVFRNREAYRGETLHGEVTLVLPPANDAGADDPAMHHERSWEVRVHAHIRRSPDYLGVFPITAHTSTPDTRD